MVYDLIVCTDGPAPLDGEQRSHLERLGIALCEKKLLRLEGAGHQLERLRFADQSALDCRVLFLTARQRQRSPLPEKLGCPPASDGMVPVDDLQRSRRRGVFVAGNAADGLQASILAAAEGYKAAYAINEELLDEFIEETCRDVPAGTA